MKEWLEIGIHQVNALLKSDADYLEILKRLEAARERYELAVNCLTDEQQQQIEDYIGFCEEAEYQRTFTDYYFGKRNG